jgi:hypothetical protein
VIVDHVDPSKGTGEPLREAESVVVRFKVVDAATGSPLPGSSPAAWIDPRREGATTSPEQCAAQVKRIAEGSTFSRTELDLAAFYVVILNADTTLR